MYVTIHITYMNSKQKEEYLIRKYIEFDTDPKRDLYGHAIGEAKCKICRKTFQNSRSIYKHLQRCHPREVNQKPKEKFVPIPFLPVATVPSISLGKSLSPDRKALLTSICCLGMSLNMTSKDAFRRFINTINPSYNVPNLKIIRADMLIYAKEIQNGIVNSMKNKCFSFITDGGTVNDNSFYPVVIFTPEKLFLYSLPRLKSTDSTTLAKTFSESLNKLIKNGGTLIASCTDNAANVVRATAMGIKDTIEDYTKQKVIRISCGVHTANLALHDLQAQNPEFSQFTEDLKQIIIFCRTPEVKRILKSEQAKGKIPKWQDIKWNIIHDSLCYIMENKAIVESCLTNISLKRDFELVEIPAKWDDYMEILKPFAAFIKNIQTSHCLLYEFYELYSKLMEDLENTILEEGLELKAALISRFNDTADGLLAELCYIFTPKGLDMCRKEFVKFIYPEENIDASEEDIVVYKRYIALKDKFIEVAKYYNLYTDQIEYLYFDYLRNHTFTQDKLMNQWRCYVYKEVYDVHDKKKIDSTKEFTECIIRLLSFPSTEAIVERLFSILEYLFPSSRYSAKDDLMEAQMIIRVNDSFNNGGLK